MSWSKLAEIAAQYAHKGSRVYIAGRLHTSRWENAQTGAPHASVEIVDDLILRDRPAPQATPTNEQDAREPQQSTRAPSPPSSTQQPICQPPQPVQLRDSSAQPSKRRRNDR